MTCHPSHTRGAGADDLGADKAAAEVEAKAKARPLCGLEDCDCGYTIGEMLKALEAVRTALQPNEIALTLKHPGIEKAMMERRLPYTLVLQVNKAIALAKEKS